MFLVQTLQLPTVINLKRPLCVTNQLIDRWLSHNKRTKDYRKWLCFHEELFLSLSESQEC